MPDLLPAAADAQRDISNAMKVLPARVLGPESLVAARHKGLLPLPATTIIFPPTPQTSLAPEVERGKTNRINEKLGAGVQCGMLISSPFPSNHPLCRLSDVLTVQISKISKKTSSLRFQCRPTN